MILPFKQNGNWLLELTKLHHILYEFYTFNHLEFSQKE